MSNLILYPAVETATTQTKPACAGSKFISPRRWTMSGVAAVSTAGYSTLFLLKSR